MAGAASIVALQSVIPSKVTPAGKSKRIISDCEELSPAIMAAHFRLILYYRAPAGGGIRTAELRETLSVALSEEPLLAGRLRRRPAEDGGGWEVYLNDAGVRLVQAQASPLMDHLFDPANQTEEEAEWALAYWRDIDTDNPHQSALLYLQITDFQKSGCSIGISCSLLLADPLFLIGFLLKWSNNHRRLTSAGTLTSALSLFNPSRPLPAHLVAVSAAPPPASTLLFRLPPSSPFLLGTLPCQCGNFTFLCSDRAGDVHARELCANGGQARGTGMKAARWEELGAGLIEFVADVVPVRVSCRIVLGRDRRALVVAMTPPDGSDAFLSVTVPVSVSECS